MAMKFVNLKFGTYKKLSPLRFQATDQFKYIFRFDFIMSLLSAWNIFRQVMERLGGPRWAPKVGGTIH